METDAIPLTGRVLFALVLPLAIAVGMFVVALAGAGGIRRGTRLVPGLLAAAALAPPLATFFAVRLIIDALQEVAVGTRGIGAISGSLWEATQPLIYAFWATFALCALTAVMAIARWSPNEPTGAGPAGRTAFGIGVITIAIVAVLATSRLFLATSQTIVHVIDPNAEQTASIAETAQGIASRLVVTAGTSVAMSILLVAAILVSVIVNRKREPPLARVFAFAAFAAAAATIPLILEYRAWAARLYETALTGQFPP